MKEQKQALRERMLATRAALAPAHREAEARAAWESVLAMPLEGPVFVWYGVRDELPTAGLIDRLLEQHQVCVPRMRPRRQLEAARWTGTLVPGGFGIPTSDGEVLTPRTVLVPGLAFDERGGRLGYGAGYYDRWLSAHPGVRTIGMGLACSRVDRVPMEAHDVVLDEVRFGGARLPFPEGLRQTHATPRFDPASLPAGLRADHQTKPGVWGRVVLHEGRVDLCLGSDRATLEPGRPGTIPPGVPHHLDGDGPFVLQVEFWRRG